MVHQELALKSRLPQPSPALSKYLAEAGEEETAMKIPASRPAPTHFTNEGPASSVGAAAAATGSNSRCSKTSAGASSTASAARCNGDEPRGPAKGETKLTAVSATAATAAPSNNPTSACPERAMVSPTPPST